MKRVPVLQNPDHRAALIDHLRAEFSDSYDCTRVWEAWAVGTMGEDDFEPVTNRLEEIADGVLMALSPALSHAPGDGQPCEHCGRASLVWFAPNKLWNLVMGGPDAKDDPGGHLCPYCFILKAEEVGVRPTAWVVSEEVLPVEPASEEVQRYVDLCKDLSNNGEYSWWARLAEILSERVASPPPSGAVEAWKEVADFRTEIDQKLSIDFPNYAEWTVTLPAGHWRALVAALSNDPVTPVHQNTKNGPDDGERCDCCGRDYAIIYRVPNDLWSKIAPHMETLGLHSEHQGGGLLCPDCASAKAAKIGVTLRFDADTSWALERCCSAISPCNHQRRDPTTICDTCKAAHETVGRVTGRAVQTHECEFHIGQPVRLANPYAEDDPDLVFYVTGISWEYRRGIWDITIASKDEIEKRHGATDGFGPSDLVPA